MEKQFDIIIIGAGAAGMTAALYALRNNKTVLILESEDIGGQIATSPKLENYPSIKAISGSDFASNLFSQIEDLGVEFDISEVESVTKEDNLFKVESTYGTYKALSVIIANGVKHRHTGIDKEFKLIGKGVHYCATCDGPAYKDQEVALIGDANSAFQYAIALSNYCKKVKMYTLFDKYFAEPALIKILESKDNIEVKKGVTLIDMQGDTKLEGLVFKDTYGSDTFEVKTNALFVAIGQLPDNSRFSNLVDLDKAGYIVSDETCKTKTPGVFVAGDTRTKQIRQVATATADGAIAACAACSYIDSIR